MKIKDFLWGLLLIALFSYVLSPWTKDQFIDFTMRYPYVAGFIKFAILSTMGELLAIRLSLGYWKKPLGFAFRVAVWGIIGLMVTLIFQVFSNGVFESMHKGYLPWEGSTLAFAFFTSMLMNCFFAPVFMVFHKLSDTYIDLKHTKSEAIITWEKVLRTPDWIYFTKFVIAKTIPFFWVPAHTITFLLPSAYRIGFAALLSIVLGLILSFKKR